MLVSVAEDVLVYKHAGVSTTLDYKLDWSLWLAGDTITGSTWSVPAGLTKVSDSHDTTTSTIWVSGGTSGADYEVVNSITTAQGRSEAKSLTFKVHSRGV